MNETGKARLGHLSKMEKASRRMAAGRAVLAAKREGSREAFIHGVIADSGKPRPRPRAGWDQVPTPPTVFSESFSPVDSQIPRRSCAFSVS